MQGVGTRPASAGGPARRGDVVFRVRSGLSRAAVAAIDAMALTSRGQVVSWSERDVQVPAALHASWRALCAEHGLQYDVLVPDVDALLEASQPSATRRQAHDPRAGGGSHPHSRAISRAATRAAFHQSFHDHDHPTDGIPAFLGAMAAAHPSLASLHSIGTSYEGISPVSPLHLRPMHLPSYVSPLSDVVCRQGAT